MPRAVTARGPQSLLARSTWRVGGRGKAACVLRCFAPHPNFRSSRSVCLNKNLIAIALGAAFAIPNSAFADTKVYGKFNIGFENQKDEIQLDKKYAERTWVFKDQNNSSRLGFKDDQAVGVADLKRSEERQEGKRCVSTCIFRWSPEH